MSTREEMLARVRRSLNRPEGAPQPVPLPPFATPGAAPRATSGAAASPGRLADRDGLVEQFASEMEGVGGTVRHLASMDEVCGYLDALSPGPGQSTIIVTSRLAERAPALARWVAERAPGAVLDGDPDGDDARRARLLAADVGVTGSEYAIADTGTLVLVAGVERHRLLSLLPPVHVCVLYRDRIVANLPELLGRLREEPQPADLPLSITFITGPSRSADIELTLARGVHGPREVHVLILPPDVDSGG